MAVYNVQTTYNIRWEQQEIEYYKQMVRIDLMTKLGLMLDFTKSYKLTFSTNKITEGDFVKLTIRVEYNEI